MLRLLLFVAAVATVGAAACAPPTPTPAMPTATPVVVARPTSTPTPTATPVANIYVTVPSPDTIVSSPLTVSGRARVFEAVVWARLRDATGTILSQAQGLASEGAPGWGAFAIVLSFTQPPTEQPGQIEVFSYSPKDGSEENRAVVPVRLQRR